MILLKSEILERIENGQIQITPFCANQLGVNSYDLHLGPKMLCLNKVGILDTKEDVSEFYTPQTVKNDGNGKGDYFELWPGILYLGVTAEYTETHGFIPVMEGKSSLGRMGIECHVCAGMGDDGFCGYWTLEIRVMVPTKMYIGMPIGQIVYHSVLGVSNSGYKKAGSYNNAAQEPGIPNLWKKEHQFI